MEPRNLLEIVQGWLLHEAPHYVVDRYVHPVWLGWIQCSCKGVSSIARIEIDKICLIGTERRYYTQEHNESCTSLNRNPSNCYCGEKVINIHDSEGFSNLKDLIQENHDKLLAMDKKNDENRT